MHGYELRKQLTTKLGAFRAAISYGSLYPTLRRLQAAGWITESGPDEAVPAGGHPADDQPPRPGGLQDHRRGQGAVPGTARPGRAGDLRRPRLRHPLRVLLPYRPADPDPDPRGAPAPGGGTPGRTSGCARPGPRSGSTRTRSNFSGTASMRANARSAGWRNSSRPSDPGASRAHPPSGRRQHNAAERPAPTDLSEPTPGDRGGI